MEEENEDSLIVEEVDDFEVEDAISSLMSSLIPSTSPSTGLELAMVEENPGVASLLEDAVTDSSSMNSEIISATAEDFSEIASDTSAGTACFSVEIVSEEDSDIADDFCSENDPETVDELFVKTSETAWDCWLDAVSTVSITELFLVIVSLVDSE